MFKNFYLFFQIYQGRTIDTVSASGIVCFTFLLIAFFPPRSLIFFPEILIFARFLLILAICLDLLVLMRFYWWQRVSGMKSDIYGYLRWDNTIEIHIGEAKSMEFQRRILRTIKFARENGHYIEFTSGILTYGEVIERYGRAVVSIKPLGMFSRMLNSSTAIKYNPPYDVLHPLKVVLDPQKMKKNTL